MNRQVLRAGGLALAWALFGAGAAFAQQGAAPAAGAPSARPPMVLPVISPARLAAARDVVVASGLSRSFDTIVPELMSQLDSTVTQTRPELAPDLKIVLTQLEPEFQAQESQFVDAAAQAVAADIDTADLKQIAVFFNSSAGKKYVNSEPDMLGHMMDSIHGISEQLSEHMMERVRQEMQKRGKQM